MACRPRALQEDAIHHLGVHQVDSRLKNGIVALLDPLPEKRSLDPIHAAAREILAENGYAPNGEKRESTSLPA